MSFKIVFAGVAVLSVWISTYYFIAIGNTCIYSKQEIKIGKRYPKVNERQNYTQTMRLRAEQYHLRCGELMLEQDKRQVKSNTPNLIVDEEHKLLYCLIPKVACSNLLRIFQILSGKINQTDPLKITDRAVNQYRGYLTRLNSYSKEQIEYRLQHYRKVLFVREPLERILSAYRQKLMSPGEDIFTRNFGRQIIKMFRSNPSQKSLVLGNDATFGEFVQYLIQRHASGLDFNEHWATYSDLCSPCQVQYDFVGRFETLDDDVDFLLESIGVSDTIRFPRRNETYKATETNDVLYKFYRDIAPKNIEKLRQIYAKDFKLFDYALPAEIINIIGENAP